MFYSLPHHSSFYCYYYWYHHITHIALFNMPVWISHSHMPVWISLLTIIISLLVVACNSLKYIDSTCVSISALTLPTFSTATMMYCCYCYYTYAVLMLIINIWFVRFRFSLNIPVPISHYTYSIISWLTKTTSQFQSSSYCTVLYCIVNIHTHTHTHTHTHSILHLTINSHSWSDVSIFQQSTFWKLHSTTAHIVPTSRLQKIKLVLCFMLKKIFIDLFLTMI